ncbi:MAG: saccharopine dehydrogenase NADP-binding domain-containing protein [Chloroflexi bacterium]|nr:saccharopine dehydrogenase NADP-binding domain-containing protein [Chloroflexota bacterium]
MKRILLLGAGLVTRPLVNYLLDEPDFFMTIASRTLSKAEALVGNHLNAEAVKLDVVNDGIEPLEKLVADHDLAISLLPYAYHVKVADLCIKHKKHLVTTSYVSKDMKERDAAAKEAGVMLLNEIGVDPGIDHMSAMQVIDRVKSKGGKITAFRSYCGGLPAPEANDNPYGYKFSWSPKGVVLAATNSARYLLNGKIVDIPTGKLFEDNHILDVEGLGKFEAYPNRDSLGYIDIYGLEGVNTMYRGTLRNLDWCRTWDKITEMGLLSKEEILDLSGKTYLEFMAGVVGADPEGDVKAHIAEKLGIKPDDPVIKKLEHIGIFSDEEKLTCEKSSPLDVLADLLLRELFYRKGERDMIIMQHEFDAEYPGGKKEHITSLFIDYGIPHGDTAMARTVGLPAAIATRMILQGLLKGSGVIIPVIPEIYNPVLKELVEKHGVHFTEKVKEVVA